MSRRMSFGPGRAGPLADAASMHNSRSSLRSETPIKDRHMPPKDRRKSRLSLCSDDMEALSKRARQDHGSAPFNRATSSMLPPTAANPTMMDGMSAVERVRMRRMMQTNNMTVSMQHFAHDEFSMNNTSTSFDVDGSYVSSRPMMAGTPSFRRSTAESNSRRQSIAVFRQPSNSQDSEHSNFSVQSSMLPPSYSRPQTLSQFSVDSGEDASVDNGIIDPVEGAGLRSSNRQLQLRVEQLEREKMELRMSKAPLEARLRQQQETAEREQMRLLQEIEQLNTARSQAEDEKRDLILKNDAMEGEIRQLRLELRKASSQFAYSSSSGSIYSCSETHGGIMWNQTDTKTHKELVELKENFEALQLDKVSIEKELHATKIELESTVRQLEDLANEYDSITKSTNSNRDAEIQLEDLTNEHIAMSAQLNAVCADLAATKARADATVDAMHKLHKDEVEHLNFEISVLKTRAGKQESSHASSLDMEEEDEAVLRARIEERDRRIQELEEELQKGEELRRQMHNRIQELRGNIRVFVRCRPFLPNDNQAHNPAIQVSPDGESLRITDPRHETPSEFKFDKVFPPSAGQDSVFEEVSDFVQSALDGYHVCLFSYGQTGSGKTHTMQGSGNGTMRGVIPRAVEQILMQANKMQIQKWEFRLSASFLEIYNESLKDLLVTLDQAKTDEQPKLQIKRNRAGKSFVDGLTEIPINTIDSLKGMGQLETLMSVAARARSVASTKMNAVSSRSHSVFILHIRGRNLESGAEVQGSLNLCDLAGSERLDRSGAGSDAKRLKETQSINKSLSCLGDVFNALAQRANHVPYRNSKLTYLLQDCLSGDGKALMFVNLSPTAESSSESLCSLRFAQRVNQVELGKPTKNIQYNAT